MPSSGKITDVEDNFESINKIPQVNRVINTNTKEKSARL